MLSQGIKLGLLVLVALPARAQPPLISENLSIISAAYIYVSPGEEPARIDESKVVSSLNNVSIRFIISPGTQSSIQNYTLRQEIARRLGVGLEAITLEQLPHGNSPVLMGSFRRFPTRNEIKKALVARIVPAGFVASQIVPPYVIDNGSNSKALLAYAGLYVAMETFHHVFLDWWVSICTQVRQRTGVAGLTAFLFIYGSACNISLASIHVWGGVNHQSLLSMTFVGLGMSALGAGFTAFGDGATDVRKSQGQLSRDEVNDWKRRRDFVGAFTGVQSQLGFYWSSAIFWALERAIEIRLGYKAFYGKNSPMLLITTPEVANSPEFRRTYPTAFVSVVPSKLAVASAEVRTQVAPGRVFRTFEALGTVGTATKHFCGNLLALASRRIW